MANSIKVKDVYAAAAKLMEAGLGEKELVMFTDEEGNGLTFAMDTFTTPESYGRENLEYMSLPASPDYIMKNCVLFG